MAAERLVVLGRVQGVGYRWWTVATARRLGVRGWVRNRPDGSVEILAAGDQAALDAFADECTRGPGAAEVTAIHRQPAEDQGLGPMEQRATA
jgi:acylphosphatase